MITKPLPTQSYLLECFDYSPTSGDLRWRRRPPSHFGSARVWKIWNTKYSGKIVGNVHSSGYVQTSVDDIHYTVHRLVWKLVYGIDPEFHIDHRNTAKSENHAGNLRVADYSQNCANKAGRKNHLFPKGVSPHKSGKYQVHIQFRGVRRYLGLYETPELGHIAYIEAANEMHGAFVNTGKRTQ